MIKQNFAIWFPAIVILVGCSPAPVKVAGTVTLDGAPLDHVEVYFAPTDNEARKAARMGHAVSDELGRITLTGLNGAETIDEGEYIVTFSRWIAPDGKPVPPGGDYVSAKAKQTIPPLYTSPRRSPYKIHISPGNDTFAFDLKSEQN